MEAIMGLALMALFFLGPLFAFYYIGSTIEKNHYKDIISREKATINIPLVTSKKVVDEEKIENAKLVAASVVISVDNFKRFLAAIVNLVGGKITAYESLMDRARREAMLRIKEKAIGSDMIINTRIETMTISKGASKSTGTVEILAYGTAIKLKKDEIYTS